MKKELLQDLLLFYSSKEQKLISLADYAAAMSEDQKFIYYACGESVARLDKLPQNEPVKEKGYAVLYLTDEVDEFVMNMLGKYEEKEFKSVKAEDLGLPRIRLRTRRPRSLKKPMSSCLNFKREPRRRCGRCKNCRAS
jgi:molecular chaperone HtpG